MTGNISGDHQQCCYVYWLSALFAVAAVVIGITASWNPGVTQVKYRSWTLPNLQGPFIGREADIDKILKILDYEHSSVLILSIIGSPAIGKSTLAIHVGYKLEEMAVHVHYVDMAEIPDITILATSVLDSAGIEVAESSDPKKLLLKWARDVGCNTLLILDNCDAFYHDSASWKQQLQNFIAKVTGVRIQQTGAIKFLLTSQNQLVFLDAYEHYHLSVLSVESAIVLFTSLIKESSLNTTMVEQICRRVDRSPLALKITAQILKQDICDVDCIGAQLGKDRIGFLSQPEFQRQMDVLFNLSFVNLQPEYQTCGMQLSLFRESFTKGAAVTVLSRESSTVDKCLHALQKSSLLEWFDKEGARRYQFHKLTADFFCDKFFESYDGMEFFAVISNYMEYYGNLLIHNDNQVPHDEQRNIFLYCAFTKILASDEFINATTTVREKICSVKVSTPENHSACLEKMKQVNAMIYERLCSKFETLDSNYHEATEEISSRLHFHRSKK